MTIDERPPNAVLLVPGLGPALDSKWAEDQPLSWHVDALLVAIARAAIARRWRILMPADERFAPLVADVVAEYSTAREAEPASGVVEGRASSRPMAFVTLGGSSVKKAPRDAAAWSALGSLLRPQVALGAVDETLQGLDEAQKANSLQGMILVGNGPEVRQARKLGLLRQIPIHHLLDGRPPRQRERVRQAGSDIESELGRELQGLRERLILIQPLVGESAQRQDLPEPPPDFWRFPAYPLLAERLLSSMGDGNPAMR